METDKTEKRFQWRYSLPASEATLLLLFVVLFLPTSANLRGQGSRIAYGIDSLMWRIIFYRDGTVDTRLELYALAYLPYIFLKYLLLFQLYRYYRRLTTRKGVLIVALLSEIQMFVMLEIPAIIRFILQNGNWTARSWFIPIPFVLITCILLLFLVPRPESEPMWIDKEEKKSWLKPEKDLVDTSQEPSIPSSISRRAVILDNLKAHPIRSAIVIGLFIVYLPIVYQIHLNLVAEKVGLSAGMYLWRTTGCSLFPIPVDYTWFGIGAGWAFTQLTPLEVYIYTLFYPSFAPRVMWSVMWLTLGTIYIINPLLKSSDNG